MMSPAQLVLIIHMYVERALHGPKEPSITQYSGTGSSCLWFVLAGSYLPGTASAPDLPQRTRRVLRTAKHRRAVSSSAQSCLQQTRTSCRTGRPCTVVAAAAAVSGRAQIDASAKTRRRLIGGARNSILFGMAADRRSPA